MSDNKSMEESNSDTSSAELLKKSCSLAKAKIIISIDKTIDQEDPIDYIRLGNKNIENKLYEVGLVYLDRAIELDENLFEAYFYRGYAKRELELYEESLTEFKAALKINPKHIASLYQYSYSLCSLNKSDEALIIANQLVEVEPDWNTYMHRASIKRSLGDDIGAKQDEEQAWKLGHDFSVF